MKPNTKEKLKTVTIGIKELDWEDLSYEINEILSDKGISDEEIPESIVDIISEIVIDKIEYYQNHRQLNGL